MTSRLLSVFALALCATSAHAAEYWVGGAETCDFPTIQAAIAAAHETPDADTIRMAMTKVRTRHRSSFMNRIGCALDVTRNLPTRPKLLLTATILPGARQANASLVTCRALSMEC